MMLRLYFIAMRVKNSTNRGVNSSSRRAVSDDSAAGTSTWSWLVIISGNRRKSIRYSEAVSKTSWHPYTSTLS